MTNRLQECLARGAVALTDDALSAAQLEIFLINSSTSSSRRAWRRARIQSRAAWLSETWEKLGEDALLLGPTQARALWTRVIGDTDGGTAVMHKNALATAAQQAWQLLLDWDLVPEDQRARHGESSFAMFLRWAERYQARLYEAGWIDRPLLTARVRTAVERGALRREEFLLADHRTHLPAFERLATTLVSTGHEVGVWRPDPISRSVGRIGLGDPREELDAALTWAHEYLTARPSARIALVVPPEAGVDACIERWLAAVNPSGDDDFGVASPSVVQRSPGVVEPLLGAALDCLELLGSSSSFTTLSRVLRCGFLDGDEGGRRALLEAELRSVLAAQTDFPSAFRYGGLAKRMAATIPLFAARVSDALNRLDDLPRVQSATSWARFMDDTLQGLGWHGAGAFAPAHITELWAHATAEFCSLTPIVGGLTYEQAVDELEGLLLRTPRAIELPLTGVTIFSSLEQVGPGYDAAWCTGMSDRAWPATPRLNSLLPFGLQRSQAMPYASPEANLMRCRQQTASFIARIPDVVFSYPVVIDDEPAAPSALIRDFEIGERQAARRLAYPGQVYAAPRGAIEIVDDPVPAMSETVVPGGARTIALQAESPLRAFIEGRLRARPLDRPERGIGPRLRGVIAHAALESAYRSIASRAAAIELIRRGELGEVVRRSTDRALVELARTVGRAQHALRELERARLEALVTAMVNRDVERDDFTIEALEIREEVELSGVRLRCRIDRLDCLADGRLAIIDYKTGRNVTTSGLFTARLLEPQLPLYSLAVEQPPGALVYAALRPDGVTFRGVWDPADLFPGRPTKLPEDRDWSAQRSLWTEQLTTLIAELVAGDGRIFPDAVSSLRDSFATLSRACEIGSETADGAFGSDV